MADPICALTSSGATGTAGDVPDSECPDDAASTAALASPAVAAEALALVERWQGVAGVTLTRVGLLGTPIRRGVA